MIIVLRDDYDCLFTDCLEQTNILVIDLEPKLAIQINQRSPVDDTTIHTKQLHVEGGSIDQVAT